MMKFTISELINQALYFTSVKQLTSGYAYKFHEENEATFVSLPKVCRENKRMSHRIFFSFILVYLFTAIHCQDIPSDDIKSIQEEAQILMNKLNAFSQETQSLISRLNKIVSLNNGGSFVKPNTSTESRILKLQNKILELQKKIAELSAKAAQQEITIDEFKSNLRHLEKEQEILRKQLDEEKKESHITEEDRKLLSNLTHSFNNLDNEMKILTKFFEEREYERKIEKLIQECVEEVRKSNFDECKTILTSINNDMKLPSIVNGIYNRRIRNFDLVIKFSESLSNIKRKFLVYKALYDEMDSNGHKNVHKMAKIVEKLQNILKNLPDVLKEDLEILLKDIKFAMINIEIEKFRSRLFKSDLTDVERIFKLYFNEDFLKEVMKDTITEQYPLYELGELIQVVNNFTDVNHKILGFSAVLHNMREYGDLNKPEIFRLASYMKQCRYSQGVTEDNKKFLWTTISSLPSIVFNVIFSDNLCIHNVELNEYIYAEGNPRDGKQQRKVYTWVPGGSVHSWKFEYKDDSFIITDEYHTGEVLYAEIEFLKEPHYGGGTIEKVNTQKPSDKAIASLWSLELKSDNSCYIINEFTHDYLTLFEFDLYDNERRNVVTWDKQGSKSNKAHILWSISKSCN